jgi:predicted TIM-barrel fold metal-dependent hydrolase
MVIDVWMQQPTLRFLEHEMLASLRRWTGTAIPSTQPPLALTVDAMDAAGVDFGLLSAWTAPHQPPLISNEEVAVWVAEHPARFAGLAAVNLNKPMEAVRELRRCVSDLGFRGLRVVPWLWEAPPTGRRYGAVSFVSRAGAGVGRAGLRPRRARPVLRRLRTRATRSCQGSGSGRWPGSVGVSAYGRRLQRVAGSR